MVAKQCCIVQNSWQKWVITVTFDPMDGFWHDCLVITIGLPWKNYPKMTPVMSKSIHWIKSYSNISFLSAVLFNTTLFCHHLLTALKKPTPKCSLSCPNPSKGISFYGSWFIQVFRWFVLIIRQLLKTHKYPLQVEFYPLLVFKCHLKETKPYQTKPNQLQPYTNIPNVFLNPLPLRCR